ncbi:3-dehydroquinate synthase II [Promethearchaeum syntrophicum]|uniref:3-dehydroquinate synthase II n=1 Tax=Promethearchaeum syntrophicum TaxID=2594042 RepID=A0AC61ZU01_9ARCH
MRTLTKYLSEMQSGEKVFVVDKQGNFCIVSVGRVKIDT